MVTIARVPASVRTRLHLPIAVMLAATALAWIGLLWLAAGSAMAADPAELRVEPSTVTVDGGEEFTVEIIQRAEVPTTGAQISLLFDPELVEVVDVRPGEVYAGALFLYGRADDGTSASIPALLEQSNQTGIMRNVATFLLPGSGAVPPGEVTFLTVTLKGRYGDGGSSALDVVKVAMLDANGAVLEVTSTDGDVSVGAAAAPSGVTPAPSFEPSASPSAAGPDPSSEPALVSIIPTDLDLTAGGQARIFLVARTSGPSSSVVADLTFDPEKLEIIGLEAGPAWRGANVVAGGAGRSVDEAIADANATGTLVQAGVFLLPNAPELPSGEGIFLGVLVRARAAGTSELSISGEVVLDALGAEVPLASAGVAGGESPGGGPGASAGGGVDPIVLALLVIGGIGVGSVLLLRTGAVPAHRLRRWPYAVSLLLALIPVTMFAGLTLMLVVNSVGVFVDPGITALFSGRFSSQFSLGGITGDWGLVPAVWGTIAITGIAVAIAMPVSLAMAVIATEFPMGPLGRVLRPLLGVLSGVPPIVYAVAAVVFVTIVVSPKFAGSADFNAFDPVRIGVAAEAWPPPDVPWGPTAFAWPPNVGGIPSSTLLGGFLIALLVIPFMTPLIYDAMRNVPSAAREASFALGANRSYTLRRVILPQALPGIVAALALATLKALGDVLIVALAVGWQAETIPVPLFDVFERTGNLAATGANLLGSLQSGAGRYCDPKFPACAVGYTSALVLLAIAAAVVISATILERRLRRRLHA